MAAGTRRWWCDLSTRSGGPDSEQMCTGRGSMGEGLLTQAERSEGGGGSRHAGDVCERLQKADRPREEPGLLPRAVHRPRGQG